MDYLALDDDQKKTLIAQKMQQLEQGHFEAEMELAELRALPVDAPSEEVGMRIKKRIEDLNRTQEELSIRIQALRKIYTGFKKEN